MKMTRFAEFIAHLKAWQVFLALIAPMIALQVFVVGMIAPSGQVGSIAETELLRELAQRLIILSFIMLLLLFAWLVSVALVSNNRINSSLRPSLRVYSAAMVYVLTYCALAVYFFPHYFSSRQGLPGPIVVMHLLATAANFYILGFTAKSLVLAQKQSAVSFFDYAGAFFLMWFFPVGVWFVQPRVNKLGSAV